MKLQLMLNKNHSRVGSIISSVVSVSLLVLSGWVILNHQYVFDQWNVWQYQPSADITAISNQVGMSEKGRFYFYASRPVVDSATDFNTNCQNKDEKSAILGCYSIGRIYIRGIANHQLDGIEEVTAAHEMLHVIWERMSASDKQAVGMLLDAEYQKINNPALKERIAYYDKYEPGERLNELHSIIGTEVANVGSDLEAHYGQYFTHRNNIVSLHAGYQQLFDSIKTQSDALITELNTLAIDLKADIAQYNDEAAAISDESNTLKNNANSIDRTSASEVNAFNAKRASLLARITQLENLRVVINGKYDTYNSKLAEYNKLIVRSNELTQSLNGTLAAPPSL